MYLRFIKIHTITKKYVYVVRFRGKGLVHASYMVLTSPRAGNDNLEERKFAF